LTKYEESGIISSLIQQQELSMSMNKFIIRNDVTHHSWEASASEARLYAIGGAWDVGTYSVFRSDCPSICLSAFDFA
jgi:hypothetical protein